MISVRRLGAACAFAVALLTAASIAAVASVARTPSPVVATWHVLPGGYSLSAGLGAMWALNGDEVHDAQLYRIDPSTNTITLVTTLDFPAGGLAIAAGSLWVSDYFGNAVWRLAPNGTVQARVPTGLQPQWLHVAFGSVWVSDHHGGSLTRVDPSTNSVVATVPVGLQHTYRSGPQDITDDGTKIYVGSSNLVKLQSVNPATEAVTTPRAASGNDQFCGDLAAIDGSVWSEDNCSAMIYQLAPNGTVRQAIDPAPGVPGGLTVHNGSVWFGVDRSFDPNTFIGSNAALEEHDPATGALVSTVAIGGDASIVQDGFGDLWVFDNHHQTVRRVHV